MTTRTKRKLKGKQKNIEVDDRRDEKSLKVVVGVGLEKRRH